MGALLPAEPSSDGLGACSAANGVSSFWCSRWSRWQLPRPLSGRRSPSTHPLRLTRVLVPRRISGYFQMPDPQLGTQIAQLQHRFGRVDVIENETIEIPGSIDTYDLRAQDPHGPFGQPMVSLLAGNYPSGANEVAVTDGVAFDFDLKIGDNLERGRSDPSRRRHRPEPTESLG